MNDNQPGQAQPPSAAKSKGKGKAIGIGAGALVVVGALVAGGVYLLGGDESEDAASYTIVMPDTLVDGKFKKDSSDGDDKPEPPSDSDTEEMKAFGIENADGADGSYTNAEKQSLRVIGVHGDIPDPAKSVETMLAKMEKEQKDEQKVPGAKTETTPYKDYRPAGFKDAVLKCTDSKTTYTFDGGAPMGGALETSTCVWGDKGVLGMVTADNMQGVAEGKTKGLSAKELSEVTAKVRTEIRKKK
ncbi:hypothetical protein M1P56_04570 [Streptomyces sp. HU2014]|uniref:hypothetical protein n=1 Tax=Streptomyces sp. HU2014 TaxID=2939414 RepID=UPI0020105FC0|nr:hypothetical protein [Streptomyces sp. HU2014]UQI43682.1 hypothetical protein M1P56_04570 [Streptomyces sp. HU2014]